MPKITETTIVIGGGLIGSATAWELASDGQNVLLIEQQSQVYTHGSSFGEARISRTLGPQNDLFSYLQKMTVKEIKRLIDFLNQGPNAGYAHKMDDVYTTSPVTYLYPQSKMTEVKEILKGQKCTYEFAPNPQQAHELFGMTIPENMMVIREYERYSGTLNPKELIKKLHVAIKKTGNNIRYHTQITKLRRFKEYYDLELVDTASGESEKIKCSKIVVAAGAYNSKVLDEVAPYINTLITPKRLFLGFFSIKKTMYNALTRLQKERLRSFYPVALFNDELFYSMIEKKDEHGIPIIKVGGHLLRKKIKSLNHVWQQKLDPEEVAWCKTQAVAYLNMLNIPIEAQDLHYSEGYSCVYSLTKSEIPYVSPLIDLASEIDPNIVLAGGMSGIGAKGALAYGRIAADLILNKNNPSSEYQNARKAMGAGRLLKDIENI